MDLVFVVDASGSVGVQNFETVKDFVAKLTKPFTISSSQTRVGVVEFSLKSQVEFNLEQYNTGVAVEQAIKSIQFIGSTTGTGQAISMAKDLFNKHFRNGVPRVLVVLTDGKANKNEDIITPSEELRAAGVLTYAIGMGHRYKKEELDEIATKPTTDYVFEAEFNELVDKIDPLVEKICAGKYPLSCSLRRFLWVIDL